VGEIGISPELFYRMSYKEIILAIRGHEYSQGKEWERTRLIAYYSYAGIPKKEKNKSITAFLPLPSDSMRSNKISDERNKELRQFFIDKQKKSSPISPD